MPRKWIPVTAIAVTALLSGAAAAHAASVTVGSPLTGAFSQTTYNFVATVANTALPEPGAQTTSPITGTVLRWRVQGTGTFKLRVLHPNGGGYTAVGASAAGVGTGGSTATFTTSLPIQAGDLIGLDNTAPTETLGVGAATGASWLGWRPPFGDTETKSVPSDGATGSELAFNADVVAAPAVSEVTPSSGPTAGGTSVTIKGSDLSNASAVTFGATAASSFHVDADNQITAVSPAGAAGTVDVRVTTPSGPSAPVAADKFTYLPPPKLALLGSPKATRTGVSFSVACTSPSGEACTLASTLTARTRVRGKRVVGVAKLRNVKVGSQAMTIAANTTAVVAVRLNAKGKKLLKQFRRLPVRLNASWSAPRVLTTTLTSRKLTIRAKKHKKK